MAEYAQRLTKEQAVEFFTELFRGAHHIPGRQWGGAENVRGEHGMFKVVLRHEMATHDAELLTRLVFLAHDRCVRAFIEPAGFYMRIGITNRLRDGLIMTGHPTLEQAVASWRKHKQDAPLAPPTAAAVEVPRAD